MAYFTLITSDPFLCGNVNTDDGIIIQAAPSTVRNRSRVGLTSGTFPNHLGVKHNRYLLYGGDTFATPNKNMLVYIFSLNFNNLVIYICFL